MRLLIVTQAVDRADPVLGFFCRWIEEFALHADLEVICLKKGEHAFPQNVSVHSLGKERGGKSSLEKFLYVWKFYSYIWRLRHKYDVVLVHMNEEYMLLGGLLWRLMGKRAGLWRNHPIGSWKTRIAARLAHVVFYTSPSAFVAGFARSFRMPVGIDLQSYEKEERTAKNGTLLMLGRIDPIKRVDRVLEAVSRLSSGVIKLDIYGSPSPGKEVYAGEVRRTYTRLEEQGLLTYKGDVQHRDTPHIYAEHDIFINATPAGSFDKTIFEAMAAGCIVVTTNPDVHNVIREELRAEDNVSGIVRALQAALQLTDKEKEIEREVLRSYVRAEHGLGALVVGVLSRLG